LSTTWHVDISGITSTGSPAGWAVPLTVHNGASLAGIIIYYVGNNTTSPLFTIYRLSANGTQSALTTVSTSDPSYAGAGAKSFALPCSGNNLIDTVNYTYYVQIVDNGTGGNTFISIQQNYDFIHTLQWP